MQSEIFLGTTSSTCVRFWYHMRSQLDSYMGTLNVWKLNFDTNKYTLLWTLSRGQGSSWKEAKFSYLDNTKHSIVFEGIKGSNVGDIALDDIAFFSSNCTISPINADPTFTTTTVTTTTRSTTPTTPSTPTTTYTWNAQSQYDCNFDKDFCSWTFDSTSDFAWKRNSGSISLSYGRTHLIPHFILKIILNFNFLYRAYH
jgi:hypothetical protein